jgi:hypothetical protein
MGRARARDTRNDLDEARVPAEVTRPRKTSQPRNVLRVSEALFQQQVIDYARMRGWLVYHTHNSRKSAKGFPDIVAVRRSRLIFAELKDERSRLRGEQHEWLDALDKVVDVGVYVWRPSDLDEILRLLR